MRDSPKLYLLLAEADLTALELCNTIISRRYPQLVIHAVTSADEAIVLFKQYRHDIVISDVFFPHTTGIALAKEACTLKPDAFVMFITGDDSLNSLLTNSIYGNLCLRCIVRKPLDVPELLLSIASAITSINEVTIHSTGA